MFALLFVLATLRCISAECNETYVDNKYYTRHKLSAFEGIPADFAVNWRSGDIYYTLVSKQMKMSLYRITDKALIKIKVNNVGQSTTVDNESGVVYLATDGGIYKYDEATGVATIHAAIGEDVMYAAVTDNGRVIYAATWPHNTVHKITGRKTEVFAPIADGHGLTVDKDGNIFYVAVKTPYVLKKGDTVSIKINGINSDLMVDFFVSKSGAIYAMDEHSTLYKIDVANTYATALGSFGIQGVNAFALDGDDNILIGVTSAVWKMMPHSNSVC